MSTCLKLDFSTVGNYIAPGDPIIFCGRGFISAVAKLGGLSRASHVATIYDSNTLCETTNAQGKPYALKRNLRQAIKDYNGDIYILPLAARYRNIKGLRQSREIILQDWLDDISGKKVPYDYWQAIRCAIVTPWKAKESFSKLYCCEITGHSLEIMCFLNLNASELRPKNIHRFALYADTYYCVKGECTPLKKFNTGNPEGFGKR